MTGPFRLSTEATLDNLRDFRHFVERAGREWEIEPEVLGDLCLVVDEAVSNIVTHGYDGEGGPVDIELSRADDALVMIIRDRARPFDAAAVESPRLDAPLAERTFGGMGVFLIRKLTDRADFQPLPDGGNELRLVKQGVFG
jgi:anti-sigma regulatory factor (Ser/Thr protein kinase)